MMSFVPQPVGAVIMAVLAAAIIVWFVIQMRKDHRVVTETLPSSGQVCKGRVYDELKQFRALLEA